MSTEIAKVAGLTPQQKELVKKTVACDATDDELALFLHVADKAGLDPLQRQIWFVKRGGRVTIQAGADGLQARAAREPGFRGIICGVVCEKDDFAFDGASGTVKRHEYNAFSDRGGIKGAYAVVTRDGMAPFSALVKFQEYYDASSPLWKTKPSVMIEKVARSTALRRAFPEQFGGLYEPAEMGEKAAPVESVSVSPPVYTPPAPKITTTTDTPPTPPLTDLDAVEEAAQSAGVTAAQVSAWMLSRGMIPKGFASFGELANSMLAKMAKPENAAKWTAGAKGGSA